MTPNDSNLDPLLEQTLAEIRDEQVPPEVIAAAGRRVQAHLQQHATLHTCADFQALIPEYRAGTLPEARALLLKDHTHECVACFKALKGIPQTTIQSPATRQAVRPIYRWAVAAAVLVAAGLGFWTFGDRLRPSPSGPEAVVESEDGLIYRVSDSSSVPLIRGAEVSAGTMIRTAKDSGAMLRLRDGSHVEMRERSGFAVSESGKDMTIALDHGAVIVQAAKRKAGHLYVATRDCRVAVTGTVFSVNSGLKGSRVTVIEGTVLVAQDRHQDVLHAGDQVATSAAMGRVPVRKEIAWSRNLDAHIAMLNAVTALGKQLDQDNFPAVRYSSNLLTLVPANTVVYASIPNLSQALTEVQQVFQPKINQNPTLREWWDQNKLDQIIADMSTMSGYLGNEMVVAAPLTAAGHPGQPVIVAELNKPGFLEFAQSEIAKLAQSGGQHQISIVSDPAAIGTLAKGQCALLVLPHLVALSPDADALRQIANATPTEFATTAFGSQIAASYGSGVGLLLAADVEAMAPGAHGHATNVEYLMVQQTGNAGTAETRASMIFKGQRTGMAAWLAAPAPLGALDFISPEARLAWAAAVKQPSAILEEIGTMHPDFQQQMAGLQALLGVDLQNDLAAALGGEIAMAQDGPMLPTPSWKVVVEVYDSAKLQATLQKLVTAANGMKPIVQLEENTANGRTYYTLSSLSGKPFPEVHYTYSDGYLIAAPTQALLDSSIQNRANGNTLTRSTAFASLIPHDQYANFSAMVYFNVGPGLASLVEQFAPNKTLSGQQQQSLSDIAANLKPTLIAAYGESDRITFATSGSLFGMTVGNASLLQLLQNPGSHLH